MTTIGKWIGNKSQTVLPAKAKEDAAGKVDLGRRNMMFNTAKTVGAIVIGVGAAGLLKSCTNGVDFTEKTSKGDLLKLNDQPIVLKPGEDVSMAGITIRVVDVLYKPELYGDLPIAMIRIPKTELTREWVDGIVNSTDLRETKIYNNDWVTIGKIECLSVDIRSDTDRDTSFNLYKVR